MKEKIDIRVSNEKILKKLPKYLGEDLGEKDKYLADGSISPLYMETRKIVLDGDDPKWKSILNIIRSVKTGSSYSWADTKRIYSKDELESAKFLQLIIKTAFEPCGEELGTIYDESTACPLCGAGRTQVNDLILNVRKIPKKRDISSSIADEWVVSDKFVRVFRDNNMAGAEFLPVIDCKKGEVSTKYFQIKITGTVGRSAKSPTKFGIDPFNLDDKGEYVCPYGHVSGLSILSELYIKKENWDGSDIAVTEDMIGQRMGLLVPKPLIVISQRFYRILKKEKIRGFREEVVHVV